MANLKVAILLMVLGQCMAKKPSWLQSFKDKVHSVKDSAKKAMADRADPLKLETLFSENPPVVGSCGKAGDAMEVTSIEFDRKTLKVLARGKLMHEIQGGTITANISLGSSAKGSSIKDKFVRTMAFGFSGKHSVTEPLCKHIARTSNLSCPLPADTKEIAFGFDRLPGVIVAGIYNLEVIAVDDKENPVACIKGKLNVPVGKEGNHFRRIQQVSFAQAYGISVLALAMSFVALQ